MFTQNHGPLGRTACFKGKFPDFIHKAEGSKMRESPVSEPFGALSNDEGESAMKIQISLMLVKNLQRPISGVDDVFIDTILQFTQVS